MNLFTVDIDFSKYTDWRLPKNRKEAFRRVATTRMLEGDLDHWHASNVIASEMGLNNDQKMMYSLLFGQSYRNHWAMIVIQQFPDILTTDIKHIQKWHDENWYRAYYAKDAKWGLRKFTDFVLSIQKFCNGDSLYEKIADYSSVGNTKDNFYSLNNVIRGLYSMGRMTGWLAQQTIYEMFKFDIDYWDLQLYDDTWSQYDSLCYLYDQEELSTKRLAKKPSKECIQIMENNFHDLMEYCNDSIIHLDVYNIESCLCEFRKTCGASGRKPKEFTFWTTNELVHEYVKLKHKWSDVDWTPYVTAFMTKGKNVRDFSLNYEYFRVMVDYGLNLNTHFYYKDEPNAHELLNLTRKQTPSMLELLDDWEKTSLEKETLQKQYNPLKYLEFKNKNHFSWKDENLLLENIGV